MPGYHQRAFEVGGSYLEIPDWQKFCHYKNRPPRWIKVHTSILSDDDYLGLTPHQRGVLQEASYSRPGRTRELCAFILFVSFLRVYDSVSGEV